MMYINNRRFEWDETKAAANLRKHEIAFIDALPAFDDPMALIKDDVDHSQLEWRQTLIGRCLTEVILIVFTIRQEGATRIISARRANRKERRLYEQEG